MSDEQGQKGLQWTPLTGPALEKFTGVFAEQFASRPDDPDVEIYAAKVGRKTVFAHDSGVVRLYVAGDDGLVYSKKVYSGLGSVGLADVKPLVSASSTGLTPKTAKDGVYRNGQLSRPRGRWV